MKSRIATAISRTSSSSLSSLSMSLLATAMLAADTAAGQAATDTAVPPAIQLLLNEGAEVSEPFEVPDGLTGYAVRIGGRDMIAYVTASGEHLLFANMISADGESLTERHMAEHALPAGDESLWDTLTDADWIGIGNDDAERVIYTFTDARCPYCNALWRASQPYMDGNTQVRHILVAVLGPQSWSQGAAILNAADPSAALARHEENYDDGGMEPMAQVPPALRARLSKNNDLMRELGVRGTPATYYRDRNGDIRRVSGMPAADRIAEIFGR